MANLPNSINKKKVRLAYLREELEALFVRFITEKQAQGLSYREMASLLKDGDHNYLFYIARKHGIKKLTTGL